MRELKGDTLQNVHHVELELTDEYLYFHECPNGHKSVTWLQQHRFETLIDTGVWALHYGMPDSAFLKFYAALEDFRRFFLRAWLHRSGLTNDSVRLRLKKLSRSELQKGAFNLVFGIESQVGKIPDTPKHKDDDWTKIRNDVAHNGRFLTEEEARTNCQEILDFIVESLIWARSFMSKDLRSADVDIMLLQNQALDRLDPSILNGTISIPSVIHYTLKDLKKVTIDEAIDTITNSGLFVKP
ncbi:hypothetical protein [Litoreibacter janthinus]|nr:hypothetical protein [Litoreibacter janthinus]